MENYKINNEVLKKMKKGKFYKKDMKQIIKDVIKLWGLSGNVRGTKILDVIGKINQDGSIVIMEISEFENKYGFFLLIFNEEGINIYDCGDGEITKKGLIYKYFDVIDSMNNEFTFGKYENTSISYIKFEILDRWNQLN